MILVNLTKQPLSLYDADGRIVELPPDPRHIGIVAIGEHTSVTDEAGHRFSLNIQSVTEVKGMPEPGEGMVYIVPVEVAMALQQSRDDIFFPADVAEVRDPDGHVRRVTHLRRIISQL